LVLRIRALLSTTTLFTPFKTSSITIPSYIIFQQYFFVDDSFAIFRQSRLAKIPALILCGNTTNTSSVALVPAKAPSPKDRAIITPLGPIRRVLVFAHMNIVIVKMAVETTKMAKMATLRTLSLAGSRISTGYSNLRKPKT